MEANDELIQFRWRLAETIAWCSERAAPRTLPVLGWQAPDIETTLRTPELRPPEYDPDGRLVWNPRMVEHASRRRAELLREQGRYPPAPAANPAGGALLVSWPGGTFDCGISRTESEGYLDHHDVPPWDTWVWPFAEPGQPPRQEAIENLIAWVPPPFIGLAAAGAAINPVGCLFLAREYTAWNCDVPLLRQLDAAGLLG